MHECMDAGMNAWTYGRMDGWMDGWMEKGGRGRDSVGR